MSEFAFDHARLTTLHGLLQKEVKERQEAHEHRQARLRSLVSEANNLLVDLGLYFNARNTKNDMNNEDTIFYGFGVAPSGCVRVTAPRGSTLYGFEITWERENVVHTSKPIGRQHNQDIGPEHLSDLFEDILERIIREAAQDAQ